MCINCKGTDRCKCTGGELLPTCGCAAMIWCAECNHEPGENDRPGFDVLGGDAASRIPRRHTSIDVVTAPSR